MPAKKSNKKENEDSDLKKFLHSHRLDKEIKKYLEEKVDELNKMQFNRLKYLEERLENNRSYIEYVQNGLRMHADHVFIREKALEKRQERIEKELNIQVPQELRLSYFYKLSPTQVAEVKKKLTAEEQ